MTPQHLLFDQHRTYVDVCPGIRVAARWDDGTEYHYRVSRAIAASILGVQPRHLPKYGTDQSRMKFRLLWGLDPNFTPYYGMERKYDMLNWIPIESTDVAKKIVDDYLVRIQAYLFHRVPVQELLDIDRELMSYQHRSSKIT